jgi:hypothetical protein
MKNRTITKWLVILSFVFTLIINYLATNLPLNNLSTREISDSFDIFFVPAPYVFSIWGIIYLGLIAYVIFQTLPAQREDPRLSKVDPWFIVVNIANGLWLFSWHYQAFVLSVMIMLVILVALIQIFLIVDSSRSPSSGWFKWAAEIPFSIYLGWITVATIANATQLLYFLNWDGFGIAPELWLIIMLAAAVGISALMSFSRRNIPYALVLIWAFIGIAVKFPQVPLVSGAAWAAAAAVFMLLLAAILVKKPARR